MSVFFDSFMAELLSQKMVVHLLWKCPSFSRTRLNQTPWHAQYTAAMNSASVIKKERWGKNSYWPAPWRPKMKTLVTIWPSNVLCATDLHLEDRRWKLWWRSGRATSSPFFRFISCFLLLSRFSPSLSVSVFFFVFHLWVLFFLCFSVLVPSLHFFFIPLCASPVFPAFLRFLFPSLCVFFLWICAVLFLSSLLWFSSMVFCLGLAEVFFSVSCPKSHYFPLSLPNFSSFFLLRRSVIPSPFIRPEPVVTVAS